MDNKAATSSRYTSPAPDCRNQSSKTPQDHPAGGLSVMVTLNSSPTSGVAIGVPLSDRVGVVLGVPDELAVGDGVAEEDGVDAAVEVPVEPFE